MIYDAIVVGAGPAGSTTARELAQRGASVLLLDKARFPRDKPCGGGVTERAARLLPFDLAPVTERVVSGVHLSLKMQRGFTRWSPEPLAYLTQRRQLDAFLVERALSVGATFHDGEAVTGLEESATGTLVRTRGGAYHGRIVVGADGANGVIPKLSGLSGGRDLAVALEGNVPCPDGVPERWREVIALDLGGIPGGYGWLFPKGDHVNVGVGGWSYLSPSFRERVRSLCRFYEVPHETMYGLRAHHLPVRRPGAPLARGRIMLVGDAAGLIDPLSGEGIYAAIASGATAARAGMELLAGRRASLTYYASAIAGRFDAELRTSRHFQDVFFLLPAVYVGLLQRSDRIWRKLAALVRGDASYGDFHRALGPLGLAVDGLAALTHATPLGRLAGLPRADGAR